jgi:pyruvate/2-oxoglutarate dehydrogenase complex dihydrolipoamide acyltransferase (E2) component
MPVLGFEQETGRVATWLKAVGDRIEKGDPIAEIETEKVTVEMESPASGVIVEIVAAPGAEVAVGDPIAWLDGEG